MNWFSSCHWNLHVVILCTEGGAETRQSHFGSITGMVLYSGAPISGPPLYPLLLSVNIMQLIIFIIKNITWQRIRWCLVSKSRSSGFSNIDKVYGECFAFSPFGLGPPRETESGCWKNSSTYSKNDSGQQLFYCFLHT